MECHSRAQIFCFGLKDVSCCACCVTSHGYHVQSLYLLTIFPLLPLVLLSTLLMPQDADLDHRSPVLWIQVGFNQWEAQTRERD